MEKQTKERELQEYMNIGFKRGFDKGRTQAISEFKEALKWALDLAMPKDNALCYIQYKKDVLELMEEELNKTAQEIKA